MADELKTYQLTCPDEDCAHGFTVELSAESLTDDGDLIECPLCLEEWEWEYDSADNTLTLLLPEDDEDEDVDGIDDEEDDDEDEDEADELA